MLEEIAQFESSLSRDVSVFDQETISLIVVKEQKYLPDAFYIDKQPEIS